MLELLVCISGLLAANDYARMVEVLWDQCMDDMDPHVIAPVHRFEFLSRNSTKFALLGMFLSDAVRREESERIHTAAGG